MGLNRKKMARIKYIRQTNCKPNLHFIKLCCSVHIQLSRNPCLIVWTKFYQNAVVQNKQTKNVYRTNLYKLINVFQHKPTSLNSSPTGPWSLSKSPVLCITFIFLCCSVIAFQRTTDNLCKLLSLQAS